MVAAMTHKMMPNRTTTNCMVHHPFERGVAIATAQDMSYQVCGGLEGDVTGIPHLLSV